MSSSSASVSAPTPTPAPPTRRVADDYKPAKTDTNLAVLDFLVTEGFPRAAEQFAKEANLNLPVQLQSIQDRVEIRKAILAGDIETAIDRINNISYDILDRDPSLHFALLRLHLIELIRKHVINTPETDLGPIISFSQDKLTAITNHNPQFRDELEAAMTLLVIDMDKLTPQLKALLQPSLKRLIASQVNEALLRNEGRVGSARVCELVKLNRWVEHTAAEAGKFPPEMMSGA